MHTLYHNWPTDQLPYLEQAWGKVPAAPGKKTIPGSQSEDQGLPHRLRGRMAVGSARPPEVDRARDTTDAGQ